MKKKYSIYDYIKDPMQTNHAKEIIDYNDSKKSKTAIRLLILTVIYPFIVTFASSIMGVREERVIRSLGHSFSYFDVLMPTVIVSLCGLLFAYCAKHLLYKLFHKTASESPMLITFITGTFFVGLLYNLTNYYMSNVPAENVNPQIAYYIMMSNMIGFGITLGILSFINMVFVKDKNEIEITNEYGKENYFSFDAEPKLLEMVTDKKALAGIKGEPLRQILYNSIKAAGRDMYVFEYQLMKKIK